MGFSTSVTPDITETMPAAFSDRLSAALPNMRDIRWDVSIQGLGFCVDPDGQAYTLRGSYIRQSVSVQKDQQDTSKEPGEQSLDGLWIRSQNSWHRGAGITFYEPGTEPDTEYRFTESSGVDVWTKGQLSGLHKMSLAQTNVTGNTYVMDAGNGYLVYLSDTGILGWGTTGSYALNTNANSYNGRYYFFGYKKYIQVGWNATPSATLGIWNGGTNTVIAKNATVQPYVWYLKDRLIVAHGQNLFEVPLNSATPVDLSVATGALYSPTDAGTTWVDATDGPNAIYVAFTDGTNSGIYRFALQDASAGQTPRLSQAYQVLRLPAGEAIRKIHGYLGRYILMSTTHGVRVCAIDSNGDLIMGQLMIETTDPLTSFAGWGNFVYVGGAGIPKGGTSGGTTNLAGWTTTTGVIRINLGEPIGDTNNLVFAYANDLRADATGTATSIAFNQNGTLELAISGSGVWREGATPEPYGYLAMGKIRYGTLVPKIYRDMDMAGSMGPDSTFTIEIRDETERPYYQLRMDAATGIFPTLLLDLTRTHIYVRPVGFFTTSTSNPILTLLQMRAFPTPGRIRQIRFPLRCDDVGQDASGNRFGYEGFAWDRLAALEALEESQNPVTVVDNRTGETFTGTIDEIQYHNVVAPDRNYNNFGGHITVTFTKLA